MNDERLIADWHACYSKIYEALYRARFGHRTPDVYEFILRATGKYQRLTAPQVYWGERHEMHKGPYVALVWDAGGVYYNATFFSNGDGRFYYEELEADPKTGDRVSVRGSKREGVVQSTASLSVDDLAVFAGEVLHGRADEREG